MMATDLNAWRETKDAAALAASQARHPSRAEAGTTTPNLRLIEPPNREEVIPAH